MRKTKVSGGLKVCEETGKRVYSPSRLKWYLHCPHAFYLASHTQTETSAAMRDGLLFEGYVFGRFKGGDEQEQKLIGRKKEGTINEIKNQASHVASCFKQEDASNRAFVELDYEGERWILRGEADYVGEFENPETKETRRCIVDLKNAGQLYKDWVLFPNEPQFIQALIYPYLWLKTTGELLPFTFLVVQQQAPAPIVKTITFEPTVEDLERVEDLINKVQKDWIFDSDTSKCYDQFGRAQCMFTAHCSACRRMIERPVHGSAVDLINVLEMSLEK